MLYNRYNNKDLEEKQFKNPDAIFRGAPFWSWNTKLEEELLLSQIEVFKKMGMGGFHMHPRTGLDTPYLSDTFMKYVKICHDKAKKEGMLTWLYDEDRWPSGYGGGIVTEDESLRIRYLIFSPIEKNSHEKEPYEYKTRVAATSHGQGKMLAKYKIKLEEGYLTEYVRYEPQEIIESNDLEMNEHIWYAYLEIGPDNPWYNNKAYCNTLDKKSFEKFIDVTHETYYKALGDDFGKTIPAIFSDEPQTAYRGFLSFAEEKSDVMMPFNEDLEETFREAYGVSLMDHLPELFWELEGKKVSQIRFWFHDHLGERFTEATFDILGEWCERHDILCSGHLMNESSLLSQTISMGDAMRCYRKFGLPGIDMLCDRREFNTAKQAQSVAHQYGKEGVLSEVYGVTNWDFDFRGHKLQGDWQAALGVTVRVHHLSHLSLGGEAKRDYPASISYQSPWWKEYSYVEDHFSRLNTALTRGKPVIKVGVIHPIESYWLHFGPNNQTIGIRKQLDHNFERLTEWLLTSLLDFDFISESLLANQEAIVKPKENTTNLCIGKMEYEVIIIPGCETLRNTTMNMLESYVDKGGKVVFIGDLPKYQDGKKMNKTEVLRLKKVTESSQRISWEKGKIIESLEENRVLDIHVETNEGPNTSKHEINPFSVPGDRTNNLIYQYRTENNRDWLFICNAFPIKNQDLPISQKVVIQLKGEYKVKIYDTVKGEIRTHSCVKYKEGNTYIRNELNYHDSLLFELKKGKRIEEQSENQNMYEGTKIEATRRNTSEYLKEVEYKLDEPNVLVLDRPYYKEKQEEILRLDNKIRESLGYPLRMADVAQPWTQTEEITNNPIELIYFIHSEIDINDVELAHEMGEDASFFINDQPIIPKTVGYYIDKSIKKIYLGSLKKGLIKISVRLNYGSKTNLESMYLLGDFAVAFREQYPYIYKKPKKINFGNLVDQGFPFYGGNIKYKLKVDIESNVFKCRVAYYRGAALKVRCGEKESILAYAPYEVEFNDIIPGNQEIEITLFGNRVNTLGNLHSTDMWATYFGPDAWRTVNDKWTYGYIFKPFGILTSPKIYE